MPAKNFKIEIFALGDASHNCAQVLTANANSNGWPLHWVQQIPEQLPSESLVIVFQAARFPAPDSSPFHHCFLATDPSLFTMDSLSVRALHLSPHFLDEAWATFLQEEVHRALPARIDERTITLALLCAGLAQCLSQDVLLLRSAIAECLDPAAPEPQWHPSMPLARLVYMTAVLAIDFQNDTRENFRNALRQQSAALPFRLRSDLRMASEACFSKFWEDTHAA